MRSPSNSEHGVSLKECEDTFARLMGRKPGSIVPTGGHRRKSVMVETSEGTFVLSRRRSAARAELEAHVLHALGTFGAPVPRVLAFDGTWLVQEFLGPRLSIELAAATIERRQHLLRSAVQALGEIQRAGLRAGLHERVPRIGLRQDWIQNLLQAPATVAARLGIAAPDLDIRKLTAAMEVKSPRFIKWDARPGNAAVLVGDRIGWFDWEHCGSRAGCDDLAWLFGDEWTPDDPTFEAITLADQLAEFCDSSIRRDTHDYLMIFGAFHMCLRLSLILTLKGEGAWWSRDECLLFDKVGVTLQESYNVCIRARRWARQLQVMKPLAIWLDNVADALATA